MYTLLNSGLSLSLSLRSSFLSVNTSADLAEQRIPSKTLKDFLTRLELEELQPQALQIKSYTVLDFFSFCFSSVSNSDGLQPSSDGLKPNSDGLHPDSNASNLYNSDGLQPKAMAFNLIAIFQFKLNSVAFLDKKCLLATYIRNRKPKRLWPSVQFSLLLTLEWLDVLRTTWEPRRFAAFSDNDLLSSALNPET